MISLSNGMTELTSWAEVQETAGTSALGLFYLSLASCGVCTALKPKVVALAREYGVPVYYIDLEKVPEAGGQWSLFSIPGVVLRSQGQEAWKAARFIDLGELEQRIDRIQALSS